MGAKFHLFKRRNRTLKTVRATKAFDLRTLKTEKKSSALLRSFKSTHSFFWVSWNYLVRRSRQLHSDDAVCAGSESSFIKARLYLLLSSPAGLEYCQTMVSDWSDVRSPLEKKRGRGHGRTIYISLIVQLRLHPVVPIVPIFNTMSYIFLLNGLQGKGRPRGAESGVTIKVRVIICSKCRVLQWEEGRQWSR